MKLVYDFKCGHCLTIELQEEFSTSDFTDEKT